MFGPEAGPADPLITDSCVLRCRLWGSTVDIIGTCGLWLPGHMHLGSMFLVPTCPGKVARLRKKLSANYLGNE